MINLKLSVIIGKELSTYLDLYKLYLKVTK